jgi:hypothetical protein
MVEGKGIMNTSANRVATTLTAHPQIAVHLTVADPSLRSGQALEDEDAEMVEQAAECAARRSGEKRTLQASAPRASVRGVPTL